MNFLIRHTFRFIDWFGSIRHYWRGLYYFHGAMDPSRCAPMRHAAADQYSRSGELHILEIGSYRGESAVLWSEYGHVTCVDLWPDSMTLGIFKRNMTLARARYDIFWGDSKTILPALTPKKWFDLIYIDGDHTYEGCMADIRNALPLLVPGGTLCGDDYDVQHPGVMKAVVECFGRKGIVDHNGFFVVNQEVLWMDRSVESTNCET